MRRFVLYVRSLAEMGLGILFALGLMSATIKAVIGLVLLVRYWSSYNFGMTAGDVLAAVIIFVIVRWLLRDGTQVWKRASEASWTKG